MFPGNDGITIQSVRNTYLLDKPLKGNLKDIDENIWFLFPGEPIEFTLMNGTRSGKMTWKACTDKSIAEKILKTDEFHGQYVVYWGTESSRLYSNCNSLLVSE